MRLIKLLAANYLLSRNKQKPHECSDLDAARWNHLMAIKATKGLVKWDWNKVNRIAVVKCGRCCEVMGKAENFPPACRKRNAMMCGKCISIMLLKELDLDGTKEKDRPKPSTRKRTATSGKPRRVRKNS